MHNALTTVLLVSCCVAVAVAATTHQRRGANDYDDEVELGEACFKNLDCFQEFTVCNLTCTCISGYREFKSECVEKAVVGTKCDTDDRCSDIENAYCTSGTCQCKEGFIQPEGEAKCLKLASKEGDECSASVQCRELEAAICEANKCTIPVPGKLGEACTLVKKCDSTQHLTCKADTCQCEDSFVKHNQTCLAVAKALQDPCTVEEQCAALSATCAEGKCTVKTTTTEPPPTVGLEGDTNNEDEEEEPDYEEVIEAQNKTTSLTALKSSVMAAGVPQPVIIGSACSNTSDCSSVSHSVCNEDVCECLEEFVPAINSSACLVLATEVGEECEEDLQCRDLSEASCVSNQCKATPKVHTASITGSTGQQGKGSSSQVTATTMWVVTAAMLCACRNLHG